MEVIKKRVQRKMRLIPSGDSLGVFTPDLTAVYYFNLNMNAEVRDWGFFDAYVIEEEESEVQTDFDYVEEDPVIVEPPDKVLVPIDVPPISVTTGNWTALYSNVDTTLPTVDETPTTNDGLTRIDRLSFDTEV